MEIRESSVEYAGMAIYIFITNVIAVSV